MRGLLEVTQFSCCGTRPQSGAQTVLAAKIDYLSPKSGLITGFFQETAFIHHPPLARRGKKEKICGTLLSWARERRECRRACIRPPRPPPPPLFSPTSAA